MTVAVIGQVGRDLVLRSEGLPPTGGSTTVLERREVLGGKGANQAVGLAQLSVPVSLVGVVGDDEAGAVAIRQAQRDGIDTTGVARRGDTALLVDLVDEPGSRRLFEHVPQSSLVTVEDLQRCEAALAAADIVSLQLQQPADTLLCAARAAHRRGARVVADGNPDPELLAFVDVLRADAEEAKLLAGEPVTSVPAAVRLAEHLFGAGPDLVALAIPAVGDLLAWPGDHQLLPLSDAPVLDPTGAGDAFMAGLIAALHRGDDARQAGRLATAAAGLCVQRLGGRPDLAGAETSVS